MTERNESRIREAIDVLVNWVSSNAGERIHDSLAKKPSMRRAILIVFDLGVKHFVWFFADGGRPLQSSYLTA